MKRLRNGHKLKVWQKLFLIVFMVTAFMFNLAMLIDIRIDNRNLTKNRKQLAASTETLLRASLSKDFANARENGVLSYDTIQEIFEIYQNYYENQGILIELWHDARPFSKSLFRVDFPKVFLDVSTSQKIMIEKIGETPYSFATGGFGTLMEDYQVILAYSHKDIYALQKKRVSITITLDGIFLVFLLVFLFLLLKKMMKPLEVLTEAADEIAKGNYDKKIDIVGEDEFAVLAATFNQMTDSINNTMTQLKNENEARKTLVDNMAHELRTPLTTIRGYSEYIKLAKIDEEEKQEVLEYIIDQVKRLELLSHTLLHITSIRTEASEGTEVSTERIVNPLQHMFQEACKEKEIYIEYVIKTQSVFCNYELILILLKNLIENAVRASSVGGHIVVIIKKDGDRNQIVVKDDGIGMKQEEIDKIVQPFYRVDKARSREQGGVGLGVTLCQQIAEYHGGTLHYESELGVGTKVTMSWKNDFTS